MDRRLDQRWPANLAVKLTDIAKPQSTTCGRIVDVSHSGICVRMPLRAEPGAILKLDIADCALFGHSVHCREDGGAYYAHTALQDAYDRLVTEGVIHLNAVCCTLLVLLWPRPADRTVRAGELAPARALVPVALTGLLAMALLTVVAFWGTREMYGDKDLQPGFTHKRFGTQADPPEPRRGAPHP